MNRDKWSGKNIIKMILLLLVCIGVNIGIGQIASRFDLPFWLDSLGTCFAACIIGPIGGAIVGITSNLICGIWNDSATVYIITGAAIGITTGICYKRGFFKDLFGVLCGGAIVSFVTIIISTTISCVMNGGYTYNLWGDALFNMLGGDDNMIVNSALSETFVDIPDKVITLLAVYIVLRLLGHNKRDDYDDKEI